MGNTTVSNILKALEWFILGQYPIPCEGKKTQNNLSFGNVGLSD
jgi:hypothetical protein